MRAYKLKHKPTGLFYKPGGWPRSNSNLSKRGKSYSIKPTIPSRVRGSDGVLISTLKEDWEIIVIDTNDLVIARGLIKRVHDLVSRPVPVPLQIELEIFLDRTGQLGEEVINAN